MSSSQLEESILIAIGNYACEKNFPSILEYLRDQEESKVADELPLRLFQFRNLLNFLEDEQTSIVAHQLLEVVMTLVPVFSGTAFGSTVRTLLYRIRLLDLYVILNVEHVEPMHLLVLSNAIDNHFPEDFKSSLQKTKEQYAFARKFWLNLVNSTAALNDFLQNDHDPRLKKSVTDIRNSGLKFIDDAFQYLRKDYKSDGKLDIVSHPLWKNFEECSDSEEIDLDDVQVLLNFIKFIEFKKIKKQFDDLEDVPIQDSIQLNF